ncbi:MAG: tRNA uridine-5-carboxymethylaminomethyl(34) synthesis GTPase MnmE [Pseudomonadota bacterium]
MKSDSSETIVAVATPPGRGGVGIVRVSGAQSQAIAKSITKKTLKPRYTYFSSFYNETDDVLDQGIAVFFNGPQSFTGEDVLELHAHGSPVALDRIVKSILKLGARMARPGEFSERAFLNGKIDLAQAESIADLIDATTEEAAQLAVHSLQGEFSEKIKGLIRALIELRVRVEAAIDFSEEEIDEFEISEMRNALKTIFENIHSILSTSKRGAVLREGKSIVIAGEPNVGKSSLLNSLCGKEAAIVTAVAGTTRDILREYIHIEGMPLHVIDTAGLQSTENAIEQEGIKRAWKEIKEADEILLVVDETKHPENEIQKIWPEYLVNCCNQPSSSSPQPSSSSPQPSSSSPRRRGSSFHQKSITIVKNKIDLAGKSAEMIQHEDGAVIFLSAKTGEGLDLLRVYLKNKLMGTETSGGLILARRRHMDALERAHRLIQSAEKQLSDHAAYELCAEDIHQAQKALSEITGEFTTDDLLGEIFSKFCIGK